MLALAVASRQHAPWVGSASLSVFLSVQVCVPCGLNSFVDLRRAVDFLSFRFFFAVRTGIDDIHALYLLKRLTYYLKENFVSLQLLRLIF